MDMKKINSVLVADDEDMNRKILSGILSPEYTVYTASDGRMALEMALEHRPDLILLDIIMPELNGFEVLAELKKSEVTQDIPVIFISGLDSSRDERKGLALKAADYITKPFSVDIVKLRVRNQIQIVNQLRTIEALSNTDKLTNIPNRRCFDNRLNVEWGRAVRNKTFINILLVDIDKFKILNDAYGHLQGDLVLKAVAEILRQVVSRSTDIVARYGGEEFAVLLPETNVEGALIVAEKMRSKIEQAEFHCKDGSVIRVTVSIGINTQIPEKGASITDALAKADKALYNAKESGRNKVCKYCGT
ncbi:MAG: diguanylate cyclase [Endomicrobia bacterium]|nr:diguanylate cyclase [Endomicrobiia bacterium]MCL2507399.1 diguanylate cyclase [Endomicrobiia bacterium]